MRATPRARSRAGRGRLSRSADFDRVFRSGRSHACREFVLYVFPRGEEAPPRLGLSVSRKVGGAVERNRVKRLVREAFAAESDRLPPGMDAVVVARRDAHTLAEGEGRSGVQRVLAELLDRAVGGREDGPTPEATGASKPDASVVSAPSES
jgi:ribonuclease P protein component